MCVLIEYDLLYQPMRKQGAIVLATGGDNSNDAEGNFYGQGLRFRRNR